MFAKIIDGKAIAEKIRGEISAQVAEFKSRHGTGPTLAVVMVGDYEPSKIYIKMKERAANEVGINIQKHEFSEISREELLGLIERLNNDRNVHGILVQLPLPKGLDEQEVLAAVSPDKDSDGFNIYNMGSLFTGTERILPCTPLGIVKLLERMEIPIEGKNVVIINRSNIVGKPLAMMLLKRNATVTLCHTRTRDMREHTRNADILISATGVPGMIKRDMVKHGAVVIDVGITRQDGRLLGDVDYEAVGEKASYITPVPGGVGPMTVVMVLYNTLQAAKRQVDDS